MKKMDTKRLLSAFLAFVMVFLLIPFSAITIQAAKIEISAGDGGYIGKSYNALGNVEFNEDALTLDDIFVGKDGIFFETRSKNETNYTYALVTDFSSYAHNQSKSLDASIDVSAKIKIVELGASAKYGMKSSSSSSGEQKSEYIVMEVTHIENTSYMNVAPSTLKKMWLCDGIINPEFITAINSMKEADFFAQYGTHIVTGYSAGGTSYAAYEGAAIISNSTYSGEQNKSLGLSAGASGFGSIKTNFNISEHSDNSASIGSTTATVKSETIGGNGQVFLNKSDLTKNNVDAFVSSITDKNSRIIVDNSLKLLSIWDFIYASGDMSLYSAAKALEEYYYDHIDGEKEQIGGYSNNFLNYTDCQIITTPEELYNIRNDLDGNYVLACNIDLSGYENWEPIGSKLAPFTGRFYGNSNTVSGLNITSCTDGAAGLFGYNNGTIHGVRVKGNITVTSANGIGAVAAYNNGTISDCYDVIVYDVDYSGLTDTNSGLRKIDLEAFSSDTITIGDENGVHLVGIPNKTYTGINIVIADNDAKSPVYIVLEDVNIIGKSTNSIIYSNHNRPIFIVSIGTKNTLCGTNSQPAINVANSEIAFFGNAVLQVQGGNGNHGEAVTTVGANGNNGKNGATAVIATKAYINMTQPLTIVGGNGGNGSAGSYGSTGSKGFSTGGAAATAGTGGTGGAGGDGGDGGNGGSAISTFNKSTFVLYISSGRITLQNGSGGNGGHGGAGGTGGQGGGASGLWATAGKGGAGGDGGAGGNAGLCATLNIVCHTSNEEILNIIDGVVGSVGLGGPGGLGGAPGKENDLCSKNAGYGSDKKTPGANGRVPSAQENNIQINYSNWNNVTLSIDSVSKINYFSGDEFDKSTVSVSANGEEVYYDYSFNSQRIGVNYVKITDGNCSRLIPVYVTETVPTSIEIIEPGKVEFVKNTEFIVEGLKVKATYNNGSEAYFDEDSEGISWTKPSLTSEGNKTVTVSYDYDSNAATPALNATYTINVVRVTVTHIEVENDPNDLEYAPNEQFNPAGLVVKVFKNDGSSQTIDAASNELIYIYDFSTAGACNVTVDYNGHKAYIECTVTAHMFGNWYTVKEADHSNEGLERRDCSYATSGHYNCFETREIPKVAHTFNREIATDTYKKSDATFTSPAIYYYSCECGAMGEETFVHGTPLVNENAPHIIIDSQNVIIGNTITVKVSLKNNTGITSMRINVSYDGALLTLTNIEYNAAMGGQSILPENIETLNGNITLYWADGFANFTGDEVFATLTFFVSNSAVPGANTTLSVTYDAEDVYDVDEKNVTFFCDNGVLTFIDYIPGDISGDGVLTSKDTTRLMRYLAGWNVEVNEAALDVNGDGVVNTKDTTRLMRYLAGWNVTIH